jgi:hypothetical protein
MESTGLLGVLLLLGCGWLWFDAMRAKELATGAGRKRCQDAGVIFLDDTVALARLRLCRDGAGRLSVCRRYRFEFASDGGYRYRGEIDLLGRRITRLEIEPYRDPGV